MQLILLICFLLLPNYSLSSVGADYTPAFSHDIWNGLLKKNVSGDGRTNYRGFIADRATLQAYLDLLSKNPPQESWAKSEVMAYWINTYNAFTVKLIIDHYPVKSIKDIEKGKAWDNDFIMIGGKNYSLNIIENDILRKKYQDPRIHFALNCASVSCPKLLNAAFYPAQLETQLNNAARNFVNDHTRNTISAKSIKVSAVFDWYKSDFTKQGSLIDFLNKYSNTKIESSAVISFQDYNWSLNE